MRVFVPATLPLLGGWHRRAMVDADRGFSVTPTLREWYASADAEELEYAAMTAAARASLVLLAADGEAPSRRVVVAADVATAEPDVSLGRAAVQVSPVPFAAVAAVHADDTEAEPMVRAAVAAIAAGGGVEPAPDDETGRYAVEDADASELLWYATQEIPDLLSRS